MKRNGVEHPKTLMLADILDIPIPYAVGILESLWHWTAKFAKRGDVGKYTNKFIASGIKWPDDPDSLIDALVNASAGGCSGLLDRSDGCRLLVHDWSEHCEDSIHMALARSVELFADGTMPKLTKLSGKASKKGELSERDAIMKQYEAKYPALFVRTKEAQENYEESTVEARENGEESTVEARDAHEEEAQKRGTDSAHCHSLSLGLSHSLCLQPLSPPAPEERENSKIQKIDSEKKEGECVAECWNEKRLEFEQDPEPPHEVARLANAYLKRGTPLADLLRAVDNYFIQFKIDRSAGQTWPYKAKKFFGGEHCEIYMASGWKPKLHGKISRAAPVAQVVAVHDPPTPVPSDLILDFTRWSEAREKLQELIDPDSYKTWILTAFYVGEESESKTAWFVAPTEFNANFIRRNYAEKICEVLGCKEIKVTFRDDPAESEESNNVSYCETV
jgi:hypothetical protein